MPENLATSALLPITYTFRPKALALEDDPRQGQADEEEDEGDREWADECLLADSLEPFREIPNRPVLEEDTRRSPEPDQPGEGHHQRGQPEAGDDQALEQAGDGAGRDADQDGDRERDRPPS